MNKLNEKWLALGVFLSTMLLSASPAAAQTTYDPAADFDAGADSVLGFVTGTVAVKLFLIAAAIVAILVGLNWLKNRVPKTAS